MKHGRHFRFDVLRAACGAITLMGLARGVDATNETSNDAPPLWDLGDAAVSSSPGITATRRVDLAWTTIADVAVGDPLRFDLLHRAVTGTVTRRQDVEPRRFTIGGVIDGETPGTFAMSVHDDGAAGVLQLGAAGMYRIRGTADGSLRLEVLDESTLPWCDLDEQAPFDASPPAPARGDAPCDDASEIDLLVVYTTQARNEAGGTANLLAEIDLMVANMNTALANSAVTTRMHLVYARELAASAGEPSLGALTARGDGIVDGVHVLRDAYAADEVALVVSGGGGVANGLNSLAPESEARAFCRNGRNSLPFIIAHEVGHNLGCCHSVGDGGGCGVGLLFRFSNGHRFVGDSGTQWRTVMAYAPGTWSALYSSPLVEFDGAPTGVPASEDPGADNVLTIDLAAPTIANWRRRDTTCEDFDLPSTGDDCNGNDVPDVCEIARDLASDLDGDGVPDECQCPADVDGSGVVDVADLIAVLAAWGNTGGPEDIDESGLVDFGDLLVLLSAWGSCIPTVGGCCFTDGTCSRETDDACTATGGTYVGDDTTCLDCPAGACCLPNETCCTIVPENACLAAGGSFRGDGTTCDDECPTGACCFSDGTCSRAIQEACVASGGDFMGLRTVCYDVCPVGGCCFPDGTCSLFREDGCDAAGGLFLGVDSTCLGDTCQPADRCQEAWDADDGSYPFSTLDATTDGDRLPASCNEGNGRLFRKDVWVRYVSSCNGVAMARVCDSDFDTRLAIYADGDCLGPPIACSDDACGEDGTRSEVTFPVGEGVAYLVRIGSTSERGEGVLVLSCISGGDSPERREDD